MFRKGFLFRLVGLLVVLALLGIGGSLLFRSGYSQGFVAGSLAAGAESGTQVIPALPYGMAPYGWYGRGFGFSPIGPLLGLLFFGGLVLLFLGFFSRPFRHQYGPFGRWQAEGGPHWNPEAWEERMKAWRQAHEGWQEKDEPEKGAENTPAE